MAPRKSTPAAPKKAAAVSKKVAARRSSPATSESPDPLAIDMEWNPKSTPAVVITSYTPPSSLGTSVGPLAPGKLTKSTSKSKSTPTIMNKASTSYTPIRKPFISKPPNAKNYAVPTTPARPPFDPAGGFDLEIGSVGKDGIWRPNLESEAFKGQGEWTVTVTKLGEEVSTRHVPEWVKPEQF